MAGGHREYEVKCTLTSRDTGEVMGEGVGTCSTMESKYRYRSKWVNGSKVREENPDIADTWNTVLKIAKKRANVDAVKSTTAASDIFTQDIEDMPQVYQAQQPKAQPQTAAPRPPQPKPIDAYKAALTRAKRERGVPVEDAMAKVREVIDKEPAAYDEADIAAAVTIVDGLGQPSRSTRSWRSSCPCQTTTYRSRRRA